MVSQPSMKVMITMLCGDGGKTAKAIDGSIDREIEEVSLNRDDGLTIRFVGGRVLSIWDDGQSCCEDRYMTTDDDLAYYQGSKFFGAEVSESQDVDDGCECHEVQFLTIKTSLGVFTVETHNEHNGYYGGFSIVARLSDQSES